MCKVWCLRGRISKTVSMSRPSVSHWITQTASPRGDGCIACQTATIRATISIGRPVGLARPRKRSRAVWPRIKRRGRRCPTRRPRPLVCVRYAFGEVVRETPRKFLWDASEASWLFVVFEHGCLRRVLFLWDRGMRNYLLGQKAYGAFAWTAVASEEQTEKRS